MKKILFLPGISSVAALGLYTAGCANYNPLKDEALRFGNTAAATATSGVTATFLGNTTLYITDGQTNLLVDGFVSRPGSLRTIFGKIAPDERVVRKEFAKAGIGDIDAILVGHSHHDHALDTPVIAGWKDAPVMANRSYRYIHGGAGLPTDHDKLITVPPSGASRSFGKFRVTFVPSDHVTAHSKLQEAVEGRIEAPVVPPVRYSEYKCGDVFAIHVSHPEGALLVTTTAGAKTGSLAPYRADVVFLAVGLLSKEPVEKQEHYWRETVGAVDPDLVVPVHWDNFSKKLSGGLRPFPKIVDDTGEVFDFLKRKAEDRQRLRVLDLRESVNLKSGRVCGG